MTWPLPISNFSTSGAVCLVSESASTARSTPHEVSLDSRETNIPDGYEMRGVSISILRLGTGKDSGCRSSNGQALPRRVHKGGNQMRMRRWLAALAFHSDRRGRSNSANLAGLHEATGPVGLTGATTMCQILHGVRPSTWCSRRVLIKHEKSTPMETELHRIRWLLTTSIQARTWYSAR